MPVSIGDDAAVLLPPSGATLHTATMIRHGAELDPPAACARQLLTDANDAVHALSATPRWFTLALTLDAPDPRWLTPFAKTLADTARELSLVLVGGDTTRGPRCIALTLHGWSQRSPDV